MPWHGPDEVSDWMHDPHIIWFQVARWQPISRGTSQCLVRATTAGPRSAGVGQRQQIHDPEHDRNDR